MIFKSKKFRFFILPIILLSLFVLTYPNEPANEPGAVTFTYNDQINNQDVNVQLAPSGSGTMKNGKYIPYIPKKYPRITDVDETIDPVAERIVFLNDND